MSCDECAQEAVEGRKKCADHLERRRRYMKAWQQRQRERGLCQSCKNPAAPGRLSCTYHLAQRKASESWSPEYRNSRRYGLSVEQYESLFERQGGLCAVCQQPETAKGNNGLVKRLAVDHCHATGVVRGLLCNNCNRAIGLLGDDATALKAAIRYLEGAT